MNTIQPHPVQPIRLFHHPLSGHVHRVELFLSLLGLPFEKLLVDLTKGETRTPDFLARNPFGQLPVIEDGDVTIADSNAILVYLARRYDASGAWLPVDAIGAAQVQRWFSVAAGPLAVGPAGARVAVLFGRPRDPAPAQTAHTLFAVMEAHLAQQAFLIGAAPTLADVSLYTYTAHAPEGGVLLDAYPKLRAWLARIEALPGFVDMRCHPAAEPLALA
ncbi:MAG: glutathione S-transferase [Burkholderiales bacterium]